MYISRLTKTVIIILSFILLIIMVGMLSCFYLIKQNDYKAYFTKQFYAETGRDLLINGDLKVKIFPNLHVEANNLIITNPKNQFSVSSDFVQVDKISADIAIYPLLKGTIYFSQLSFYGLSLNLVESHSLNNWDFKPVNNADKSSANSNLRVILNSISLINTHISYTDLAKRKKIQTKNFDLFINRHNGNFTIDKNTIKFNQVSIELEKIINSNINLTINKESHLVYSGFIQVNYFSLNALVHLVKQDFPKAFQRPIYDNVIFSFILAGNESMLRLNNFVLNLKNTKLNGNLNINFAPLQVKQDLQFTNLVANEFVDLNGFKLTIESGLFNGDTRFASNFNLVTVKGKENLHLNQITLFGFNARNFSQEVTKVIKDITIFKRLITYTQTIATVQELRKAVKKIEDQHKKNYADKTNLGNFNGSVLVNNGNVRINKCVLVSSYISGECSGMVVLDKKNLNVLIKGKLLSDKEPVFINYIYFPYYIKGSFYQLNTGLDWDSIVKQTTSYYQTTTKDKPFFNKVFDSVGKVFNKESQLN